MAFPSMLEIVQLSGVGLHLTAVVLLGLSMYLWRDVHKMGSRAGFAATSGLVNVMMLVEWATRLRDAETRLRLDGVEVFPMMPIVSAVVLALSSASLTMFTRFKCASVGSSIVFWSTAGSVALLLALLTRRLDTSFYWFVLGSVALFLAGLQAWAWSLVPDTLNPPKRREQRRTGPFSWWLVAMYSLFMFGTAGGVLLGNAMLGALDSDGVLYAFLNLALRSLTLPILFPVVGLLFYWNDITLANDKDQ